MAIADLRREYQLAELRRSDLHADPIEQFRRWFDQASGARASGRFRSFLIGVYKSLFLISGRQSTEINAMTLATTDSEGHPWGRTVLLKGVDERGFIFYTNYNSRKAHELEHNPWASLTFYWSGQERQVCIGGKVTRVSRAESEAYFKSRPRGSRIGAWASNQSQAVKDRAELEARWAETEAKYPGEVPIPPHWGGYVVNPERLEFWQGRPNRLHDRLAYIRQADGTWRIERLAP